MLEGPGKHHPTEYREAKAWLTETLGGRGLVPFGLGADYHVAPRFDIRGPIPERSIIHACRRNGVERWVGRGIYQNQPSLTPGANGHATPFAAWRATPPSRPWEGRPRSGGQSRTCEWISAWWYGIWSIAEFFRHGDQTALDPWGRTNADIKHFLQKARRVTPGWWCSVPRAVRLFGLRVSAEDILALDSMARCVPLSGPAWFDFAFPIYRATLEYQVDQWPWPVSLSDRRRRRAMLGRCDTSPPRSSC